MDAVWQAQKCLCSALAAAVGACTLLLSPEPGTLYEVPFGITRAAGGAEAVKAVLCALVTHKKRFVRTGGGKN